MNIYALRINADPRKGKPYSKLPTVSEYRKIHDKASMNGFHEALNFKNEKGFTKGYIPPKHLNAIKNDNGFIVITTTSADQGNSIVGIQANCTYVGETKRNVPNDRKELDLLYHFQCQTKYSLLFDKPLPNGRAYILDDVNNEWKSSGPVFQILEKKKINNIISDAIINNCVKRNNPTLLAIQEIINDKTQNDLDEEFLEKVEKALKKQVKNPKGNKRPQKRIVTIEVYERDPEVVAAVLLAANGKCSDCNKNAPFARKNDNTPYLEVHHIKPLSKGGEDTVANAVALCPNCHRKKHYG